MDSFHENEEWFRKLVEANKNIVYNTCLSILQNQQDAEDATQEVFVKIFQKRETFKKESELTTWIYRISVRTSLDTERKKRRYKRGGLFRRVSEITEETDFEHPGVAAEKKEASKILFRAIQKLPESQRIVFVLNKIEGLNYVQISEILSTTRMSVESKMKRAKQNLQNLLKAFVDEKI